MADDRQVGQCSRQVQRLDDAALRKIQTGDRRAIEIDVLDIRAARQIYSLLKHRAISDIDRTQKLIITKIQLRQVSVAVGFSFIADL